MSHSPKFSSPIFTDTQKTYMACTDCCLFAKFFLPNSFYLHDLPKFSPAKYFPCKIDCCCHWRKNTHSWLSSVMLVCINTIVTFCGTKTITKLIKFKTALYFHIASLLLYGKSLCANQYSKTMYLKCSRSLLKGAFIMSDWLVLL